METKSKATNNNTILDAFERLKNSQFNVRNDRYGNIILSVTNGVMIWPNFRAVPSPRYGKTSRTFNLVINEETADILAKDGWNVRHKELTFDDDSVGVNVYYVNIKVNMDYYEPPIVRIFSTLNGVKVKPYTLNEENIGDVDKMDIEKFDCEIKGNPQKANPELKTGYLKKMYIITVPETTIDDKDYEEWGEDLGVDDESIVNGDVNL